MRKSSNFDFNKHFPYEFQENNTSTGFLMWKASYMWQQEQRRTLQKYHNISQMDFVILSSTYYLMVTKQKITPTILSNFTKIEPVGVAQLLKSMEQRNLIERYSIETDGKSRFVKVSENGLELLKKATITVKTLDDRFFKVAGSKTEVLKKFLLDIIKTNE